MLRRKLGLCTALAGASLVGYGAYMPAKASLAQVLLERAWRASSGRAPPPWPWADTHPVARLSVPRLEVDRIVLAGAHAEALAFGPGHLFGSSAPGETGNVVLSGHRDTHFAFLKELRREDYLELEPRRGERLRYRVERTEVVHRRDTRALAPTLDARLTLVTCYPFDAVDPGGPLRYVVHARRVP